MYNPDDKVLQLLIKFFQGGPSGENLAAGYANATAAVNAWGHERVDYDFKKGEFSHETGHFTQMVRVLLYLDLPSFLPRIPSLIFSIAFRFHTSPLPHPPILYLLTD
jgi:hypothetical protein